MIVGALRSRPVSQVSLQTHSREHSIPGTFIDSPDRPRRSRNKTSPPEEPDAPPPAPENSMADPGPARISPPKPQNYPSSLEKVKSSSQTNQTPKMVEIHEKDFNLILEDAAHDWDPAHP